MSSLSPPALGEAIEKPSNVLIKCSGQDITRRGGKLKNGVMIVLPLDISIAKGSEGVFGYLENMDSNRPELVLETQEGEIRYIGNYVDTTTNFLTIEMSHRKKNAICNDIGCILEFKELKSKLVSSSQQTDISTSDDPNGIWISNFGCSSTAYHDISGTKNSLSRASTGTSGVSMEAKDSEESSDGQSEVDEMNNHGMGGGDSDGSSHSDSDFSESDKKRRRTGRITNKTQIKKTLSRNASDKDLDMFEEEESNLSQSSHVRMSSSRLRSTPRVKYVTEEFDSAGSESEEEIIVPGIRLGGGRGGGGGGHGTDTNKKPKSGDESESSVPVVNNKKRKTTVSKHKANSKSIRKTSKEQSNASVIFASDVDVENESEGDDSSNTSTSQSSSEEYDSDRKVKSRRKSVSIKPVSASAPTGAGPVIVRGTKDKEKKAVKKAVTTHVKTKEVIVIDDDSGDGNDSEASIQSVEVITSSAASSKAQKKITSAKVRNVTSEQKEKMSDKRSKTTTTLLIDERSKSLTKAKQAPKANAKVKATDSQESPVVSRSDSRMRRSSSVVKSYAVDDVSEHEENSDDSSNDWG